MASLVAPLPQVATRGRLAGGGAGAGGCEPTFSPKNSLSSRRDSGTPHGDGTGPEQSVATDSAHAQSPCALQPEGERASQAQLTAESKRLAEPAYAGLGTGVGLRLEELPEEELSFSSPLSTSSVVAGGGQAPRRKHCLHFASTNSAGGSWSYTVKSV